jgi:tRNA uridine 5-carbamoylmethylation protein Kti12
MWHREKAIENKKMAATFCLVNFAGGKHLFRERNKKKKILPFAV